MADDFTIKEIPMGEELISVEDWNKQNNTQDDIENQPASDGDFVYKKVQTPDEDIIPVAEFEKQEKENYEDKYNILQRAYLKAKPYTDTTFEVGLTGGLGLAGAALGGTGGSAVPLAGTAAGAATGAVIGATTGYTASQRVIDAWDRIMGVKEDAPETRMEGLKEGFMDVKVGLTDALIGESLFPGGSLAVKGMAKVGKKIGVGKATKFVTRFLPKIRTKTIKKHLGHILLKNEKEVMKTAEGRAMAAAGEKVGEITGVKFSNGQITSNAEALAAETALAMEPSVVKGIKGAADTTTVSLSNAQKVAADKALRGYYSRELIEKGNIDGVVKVFKDKVKTLYKGLTGSKDALDQNVGRMSAAMDNYDTGKIVFDRIKAIKRNASSALDELYDKIPNVDMPGAVNRKVAKTAKELLSTVDERLEVPTAEYNKLMTGLIDAGREGDIDLAFLRNAKRIAGNGARSASGGANPNSLLAKRYGDIENAVEEILGEQIGTFAAGGAVRLYQTATKAYAKYAQQFKQGIVGDVLARGGRGEEAKMAMANVAGKFMDKEGLKALTAAVGDDKVVKEAIQHNARFNLLQKSKDALTGEIKPGAIAKWLNDNPSVLKFTGMRKELSSFFMNAKGMKAAESSLDAFNKSVSGRLLKGNPKAVIKNAFSSTENQVETAKMLMAEMGNDVNAKAGVISAFGDFLMDTAKVTATGFKDSMRVDASKLNAVYDLYLPAIKEFYKSSPKEMDALRLVNEGFEMLGRSGSAKAGKDLLEEAALSGNKQVQNIAAVASGLATGQYYLSLAGNKFLNAFSKRRVAEFALRAAHNPKYAKALTDLANPNLKVINEKTRRLWTSLILTPTLTQTNKEK